MAAPVEQWDPPLSGDMDLCIKANGEWYHEGRLITRQSLVKLFASILKKEGEDYFLVSPVEKWRITVEDTPFLVVAAELEAQNASGQPAIRFKTMTDDVFFLDDAHPLRMVQKEKKVQRPYVHVRQGMDALIHRNIFYALAEIAVQHQKISGIWSSGIFFPLE
jgi:hypothetical protein